MNQKPLKYILLYGLSGPIIALNIWILSLLIGYLKHPLSLLSIAAILAFLLNYPVQFIERTRINRTYAIIVVLLVTLTLLTFLGVTLVPIVIEQTTKLLNDIPNWLSSSQANLKLFSQWAEQRRLPLNLKEVTNQINGNIQTLVQQFATGAVGFAGTLLSGLLDLVLVVVLAFYMLLYGDKVWLGLVNLLPEKSRIPLTNSLKLNFHYFFLSQMLLALFMTVTLTPIFLILKLPFALLFAILIGISQLIPIIGASLGIGLVTILVLLQNWWLAIQVALLAILVQQIKDNVLAPKLLGDFIGLNPLWIFIAILMGFEIAGLLGTIVAVPIAGTIKGTFDALNNEKNRNIVSNITKMSNSDFNE
jgi:predicted PurR-regulated permease PerM